MCSAVTKSHIRTTGGIPVGIEINLPNRKYMDEFIEMKCVLDLMRLKLYPNSKEVTEALGMFHAVRKHLRKLVPFQDESVTAIVVGDGHTARLGALLAFRSAWRIHSIDPSLVPPPHFWDEVKRQRVPIDRLTCHTKKVEEVEIRPMGTTIVFLPHAHVQVDVSLKQVHSQTPNQTHVVAMPCCVDLKVEGRKPDVEYRDWGVWSPENRIRIWRGL